MILFLTQYYRGIGHSTRIKYIIEETSKYIDCVIVNHLMEPPLKFNTVKEYTLLPESQISKDSKLNIFKVIMRPELIQDRITKWKEILDTNDIKIIIFEGFPFCRHQFAYELFTMLEEAHIRGIRCICSIRDFPWDEPHERGLQDWVSKTQNLIINKYFSFVLVHGDPKYLPLLCDTVNHYNPREVMKEISNKVLYTGYVINPYQKKHHRENNHIYISCGLNKEESLSVLAKFIKVAPKFPEYQFIMPIANRYLTKQLGLRNKGNITIVDYIPNLYKALEKCAMFITYGGYNSTMEVIAGKIPAIIIPRNDGAKLEQYVRSFTLQPYNLFKVCAATNIENIGQYIKEIEKEKHFPANTNINLKGAQESARILRELYKR